MDKKESVWPEQSSMPGQGTPINNTCPGLEGTVEGSGVSKKISCLAGEQPLGTISFL